MKIYTIDINDDCGIGAMALVEMPAVDVDFQAFGKESEPVKMYFNDEQRIVRGVALRCDFPIYRFDYERGEYYIIFRKDAIKKCIRKFFKDKLVDVVNIEHDSDKMVDGVYLTESFQIDRENGLNPIEFSEVEDGSWIVSYKVDNDKVWEDIKGGKILRGFSVEGLFDLRPDNMEAFLDELI